MTRSFIFLFISLIGLILINNSEGSIFTCPNGNYQPSNSGESNLLNLPLVELSTHLADEFTQTISYSQTQGLDDPICAIEVRYSRGEALIYQIVVYRPLEYIGYNVGSLNSWQCYSISNDIIPFKSFCAASFRHNGGLISVRLSSTNELGLSRQAATQLEIHE